jgi:hypothetical protein
VLRRLQQLRTQPWPAQHAPQAAVRVDRLDEAPLPPIPLLLLQVPQPLLMLMLLPAASPLRCWAAL